VAGQPLKTEINLNCSDRSPNAGAMGSGHDTLGKPALSKLLTGKTELRERRRLWTPDRLRDIHVWTLKHLHCLGS
jgi:hypothetical protein